jgi:hypothetical protein
MENQLPKITIHGFEDWSPTLQEFLVMLGTVQIGASQDCEVTIGQKTKTMKEWQNDPSLNTVFLEANMSYVFPRNQGGKWLAAARTWLQNHTINGEMVMWCSDDVISPPMTTRMVEALAANVAEAAVKEYIEQQETEARVMLDHSRNEFWNEAERQRELSKARSKK